MPLDLFEAANAANSTRVKRGGDGGRRPKAGHLLTGPMFRHDCGEAMVPRSYDRQKDGTVTGKYLCNGAKRNGAETCSGLTVDMKAVDEAVLSYLAEVGIDAEESIRRARAAGDTAREAAAAQLAEAEATVTKAEANLVRVEGDYLDGKIGADKWRLFAAKLGAAKDEAVERRDNVRAASLAAPAEQAVPFVVDALALVRAAAQERDGDGVRQILRDLFEHFIIVSGPMEVNITEAASCFRRLPRRAA